MIIGITNNEIEQIKKNKIIISEDLAARIIRFCPSCTKNWLMSGREKAPAIPIPTSLTPLLLGSDSDWFDKQFEIYSIPIVGWWIRTGISYSFAKKKAGQLVTVSAHNRENNIISLLEFKKNNLVNKFENQCIVESMAYTYNAQSGRLIYGHECLYVSKLTPYLMEYIHWISTNSGGIIKYIYKRLPNNFNILNDLRYNPD